jgi:hypothetical protein
MTSSFAEDTINGIIYLDTLENFDLPQLEEAEVAIFQQHGAHPHYSSTFHDTSKCRFPEHWVEPGTLALAL